MDTKRYELVSENMDWASASQFCQGQRGSLVAIQDSKAQLALEAYLGGLNRQ